VHHWNGRHAAADWSKTMKQPNTIAAEDSLADALARRVFVVALAGVVTYAAAVLALLASVD
jgi:hypothetical protein